MTQGDYKHGGTRSLVVLHETHLRQFMDMWRKADTCELALPDTEDPNYASRETLLAHVLGCAARYLIWICSQLELSRPDLESHPDPAGFPARADEYLDRVLAAWQPPLRQLTEDRAYSPAHNSNWGPPYCIDAMLEHAVMHPIRHSYQLQRLLEHSTNAKIIGSAPILLVKDVVASANYYRDKLGFTYERFWGDPPGFCILWRDNFHVMLSRVEDPKHIVPHYKAVPDMWNIYFWVDDVEGLYADFKKRGAKVDYELCDQSYGCREFAIKDLVGYDIAFGQDMAKDS